MTFDYFRALHARYTQSVKLKKIVDNIGWLFVDNVLRMGVGLLVGLLVARYLGPERYGLLNYATAFASLFGMIALLGLDSILVRDLAANPKMRDTLLGSAFFLKLAASTLVLPVAICAISLTRRGATDLRYLVILFSVGSIVQTTNVISCYFQSQIASKYTVYANNVAFVVLAVFRIALVLLGASVIAFGYAALTEAVLGSILLTLAYRHNGLAVRDWHFDKQTALRLLRAGWPVIISSVAIVIYTRIDQVMLGQILDDRQVGIYSAAVRISELWYFIPMAIVGSLFPAIVESRQLGEIHFNRRIGRLYSLMAWSGILVATPITFLSSWIIHVLYGPAFLEANSVLKIHIWTGVPVALGVACCAALTAENAQVITLYTTLSGAGINILLNCMLIPSHGTRGAAVATLLSQWVVVLSTLFFARSRRTGLAILKSFVFR